VRALLVVVLIAGTAHAQQAPGQAMTQPPAAPSVMDDRWAVALALASEGLKPNASGAQNVQFAGLELSGRYRYRPAIEFGLSLIALGSKGDLGSGGLWADVRYRFYAEHAWNPYALVGLGVQSAGGKNDGDTANKGRGAFHLGGGLEWRFAHAFAAFTELDLVSIGKNDQVIAPLVIDNNYLLERYHLGGLELSLGASYYF
jgi:outer membrane protein with beta-barrel domain